MAISVCERSYRWYLHKAQELDIWRIIRVIKEVTGNSIGESYRGLEPSPMPVNRCLDSYQRLPYTCIDGVVVSPLDSRLRRVSLVKVPIDNSWPNNTILNLLKPARCVPFFFFFFCKIVPEIQHYIFLPVYRVPSLSWQRSHHHQQYQYDRREVRCWGSG